MDSKGEDMSYLMINQEKCTRDGICAESCPMGLIECQDEISYPTPIDNAEKLCVQCGHCVAVCPRGALSLKTIKPDQCPPIRNDWQLAPEQVEHFLRSRRSIRVY